MWLDNIEKNKSLYHLYKKDMPSLKDVKLYTY